VAWEVEVTDEFTAWYDALGLDDVDRVNTAIDYLAESGPSLGRPFADTLSGTRHHNLKELRPRGGYLRIIFAFDPRRIAILLLGGDKAQEWSAWYERMIPIAEQLYDLHLATLRQEGESG
jgi:hypothetical protein